MNDPDNWFWELLKPLHARHSMGRHPSCAVLHAYLKGRLPDTWRVGTRPLDPDNWTLTEVSQHTLTCPSCAQQLALMRRRELEPSWAQMWQRLPRAIQTHLTVYALALFTLFTLNAIVVTMLPPPMVALPCVLPAEPAGPSQPVNPQSSNKDLRLEGINRPVKLPRSLAGSCAPVPAPLPPWQTWWAPWVFLFWTLLLGLHIVWDWLLSPVQRRTVATSLGVIASSRGIGFAPVFL